MAAVWALDEAPGLESLVRLLASFFVDSTSEARASTADEADLLGALGHMGRGSSNSAFELGE